MIHDTEEEAGKGKKKKPLGGKALSEANFVYLKIMRISLGFYVIIMFREGRKLEQFRNYLAEFHGTMEEPFRNSEWSC